MIKPAVPAVPQQAVDVDLGPLGNMLSFYIRSINIAVSRDLDQQLAGLEVARGTGKISTLLVVDRHPGIRPSVIADVIQRDRSAMARLLEQMEQQQLLIREADQSDNRSQALFLTEHGKALAQRVRELTQQQEDRFFQRLTAREKHTVIRLLKKVLQP
ncbi:MarR family transcriptional regulator [Erwiniaceae bacterium L1_54_6]|jgi:DNA-binding MarR family transcriptional regulator|nr:MarR family transcriptional regulator [Erwiniaceae bacterium L1_54_6]